MRAKEFVTERMQTTWIRPWIASAVTKIGNYKNDLEWYNKFFKNLNASQELKQWKEQALNRPLTIKPKLLDQPNNPLSALEAEHEISGDPIKHTITIEVNVAHAPTDEKTSTNFIDRLSSLLIHELNHASQRTGQIKKSKNDDRVYDIETDVWKKLPPKALTKRDEYYLYMLNNMERDSWISQIANDIYNKLGENSLGNLNNVLKQAQKEEYAIIGGKIIQVPNLKTLWDAINYYGRFLKSSKEDTWNKVKKELYSYLSKYGK